MYQSLLRGQHVRLLALPNLQSRLLYGARVSLLVGLSAVLIAGVLGVFLGLLAGYYRGWLDDGLMRLGDIQLAFPLLVLALAVLASPWRRPLLPRMLAADRRVLEVPCSVSG